MLFDVVTWANNYKKNVLPKRPIIFNVTKWITNYEQCILEPRRHKEELDRLRFIEMKHKEEKREAKGAQLRRLKDRFIKKEKEEIQCLQLVKAERREVPIRFYRASPSGSSFELDENCASPTEKSVAPTSSWISEFGRKAAANIEDREREIRFRSRNANELFLCLKDNVDDGYCSD